MRAPLSIALFWVATSVSLPGFVDGPSSGVCRGDQPLINDVRLRLKLPSIQSVQQRMVRATRQANLFVPLLRTTLAAEVHFFTKVCAPSPEESRIVRMAGEKAVDELSVEYAELLDRRRSVGMWPDPNTAISGRLLESAAERMDVEVVAEYRKELDARQRARRMGDAAAVALLVNRRVTLGARQYDSLVRGLADDWNPQWSNARYVLGHEQYAALPALEDLTPYLTVLQLRLWTHFPPANRTVYSWQIFFGVEELVSGPNLPAQPDVFDDRPDDAESGDSQP